MQSTQQIICFDAVDWCILLKFLTTERPLKQLGTIARSAYKPVLQSFPQQSLKPLSSRSFMTNQWDIRSLLTAHSCSLLSTSPPNPQTVHLQGYWTPPNKQFTITLLFDCTCTTSYLLSHNVARLPPLDQLAAALTDLALFVTLASNVSASWVAVLGPAPLPFAVSASLPCSSCKPQHVGIFAIF
jgi:hypothetical protein